jgi:hypothetical protein
MGKSNVAVYDAQRWQEGESKDERFFFLQPGNHFNLDTRTVISKPTQEP